MSLFKILSIIKSCIIGYLLLLCIECSVPEKIANDLVPRNIQDDMGINQTRMRVFLQVGTEIRSILPWEHFLRFGNYDIIGIDTGDIKAATVPIKSTVLPGSTVTPSVFLDATKMGFDGGIFLSCTNFSSLISLGLQLGKPDDTINDYPSFNLNSGIPFRLLGLVTTPVKAQFKLYGIVSGVEKELVSNDLSITFLSVHHTNTALSAFSTVPAADLSLSSTRDSFFTELLTDLKRYDTVARSNTDNRGNDILSKKQLHKDEDEDGFDSLHVKTIQDSINAMTTIVETQCTPTSLCTTYVYNPLSDRFRNYVIGDTIPIGACEKSAVHASAQNAKVLLANRLLRMIDPTYIFPTTTPVGDAMKILPSVGPAMDSCFNLYTNISGLLEVLDDFRNGSAMQKDQTTDQLQINLLSYLKSIVDADDLGKLNPSSFSHLILWYSDYLLYAGLCSYLDNDFFSRYINHHNLLLDELKPLVDKVAPEYDNNNIILRFYVTGAFYDMILGKDRGYLQSFENKLKEHIDTLGEYGEGFAYLGYLADLVLPVLYVGLQETYVNGSQSGQRWLADTSAIVRDFSLIAQNYVNVATNWGEIPAIDDGSSLLPFLAPYSVITGDSKYTQFSNDIRRLMRDGNYTGVEQAERVGLDGNASWRMFLYPYNKTFTGTGAWQHSLDSVRKSGSIVQIPVGNDTNMLNMTVVAEENPRLGGTHDQIDHGAIQLTRYKNNSAGTTPHVDHLIIDPGYPGFSDNKRFRNEWKYCNQNVQMLWDSDFAFTKSRTEGDDSGDDDDPEKNATDEEFLGYSSDLSYDQFANRDSIRYKENGGMTGYRYQSPYKIREMAHKYVLSNSGIQDHYFEISDAITLQKMPAKTLDPISGEGKSHVTQLYKNGVELRIDYKYPKKQDFFLFIETSLFQRGQFYYNRNMEYETSHHGIRGVYTLGDSYFIIDHLPETNLPSTVSLATSWNMPRNTTRLGTNGWQQFVFNGTTPDPLTTTFPAQSRIEIAVSGATIITSVTDTNLTRYEITKNTRFLTTQLICENDLRSNDFTITQFRVADIADNIPIPSSQVFDRTTVNSGATWLRTYDDNSRDLVVYNPNQNTQMIQGITSNAKVWLLHANTTGNWTNGRLFNATSNPSFSGILPVPTTTMHRINPTSGAEYEITF